VNEENLHIDYTLSADSLIAMCGHEAIIKATTSTTNESR
jgi:hypothetical protein